MVVCVILEKVSIFTVWLKELHAKHLHAPPKTAT